MKILFATLACLASAAALADDADMHKARYIMTNLAVGGYWPGDANSSTPFPANMNVDYIRAYSSDPYTDGGAVDTTSTSTTSRSIHPPPRAIKRARPRSTRTG